MKNILTLSLLLVLLTLSTQAQNRRDDFDDDIYGSNERQDRQRQDNNNPYNDPNYYPNPQGNNGNLSRDFDDYRYNQGQNWNQGGRCAQPIQPIYVHHRPMRPRPVIIVPPAYCAPVMINPYLRYSYRPRHFRHYGYGYRRF